MNTNSTIAAINKKLNAAKVELQKERAKKDRILRPFAGKGLTDDFDFPDEYFSCMKRIGGLMNYIEACEKVIKGLKVIENNEFNF